MILRWESIICGKKEVLEWHKKKINFGMKKIATPTSKKN
jgi:hypothetical protein